MAGLQPVDDAEIEKAGYEYNSSMNPTYIPGRYNNLSKPRTAYYTNKLLNIPISVTPLLVLLLQVVSGRYFYPHPLHLCCNSGVILRYNPVVAATSR
jgi:hypothetical protein